MSLKIAINGMGVIGREMFRTLFNNNNIEIMCISDYGITSSNLVYLLKHDSVYHDWKDKIASIAAIEDGIIVNGKTIRLLNEKDPQNLRLGNYGADVVLECSGDFKSKEQLQGFINAGARHVIACYKVSNDLPTIAHNVNHTTLKHEDSIISLPQMEVQTAASVLKILNDNYTILGGTVKAYRSFTNAQPTLDSYNNDFAKGRSAPGNITPVNDLFARSIGLVVPELNGKIVGFAYRSPVTNGSILDLTVLVEKGLNLDDLRSTIKSNDNESLRYNEEHLCSSDALGYDAPQVLSNKAIILPLSNDESLISISVVYDNIRGYCNQMKRFLNWAYYNW